jgi:hypothetical protein
MLLDSHVTVASPGRRLGQMLLQDVYRVKRGAPLTLTAPLAWSPGQQFPVGPRRDNYGGTVLSTATVVSLQISLTVCWDVTRSGLVGEYRSLADGTATTSRLRELSFRYPEVETINVSETSVFLPQTTSHQILENTASHPRTPYHISEHIVSHPITIQHIPSQHTAHTITPYNTPHHTSHHTLQHTQSHPTAHRHTLQHTQSHHTAHPITPYSTPNHTL